jgi:hypothetical protein
MNTLRSMFLTTGILLCLSTFTPAADFVVAPDGDDANAGTQQRPFATIARARDAVRARIAGGLNADIEVLIRGGTYRIVEPIRFGLADSGSQQHGITYAAWPGQRPVISGGRVIGDWQVQDDGTWKTTVPEVKQGDWTFRQLFVAGRRATRARHPNVGYFRVEEVGEDRRTNFRYKPGDLKDDPNVDKIELVFLHDWSISRVRLKSIDEQSRTLAVQHQIGGPGSWCLMNWFEPNPRYFLENSQKFLDAPGEWFLDEDEGSLTYRPLPGEDPEKTEVIAPVATQLLVVKGDPEANQYVGNLHFTGLHFEHAAWAPPGGVYWGRQACTYWHPKTDETGQSHEEADAAAVQFELTEGCTLNDGRIAHTGASGLWLGRQCHGNLISGTLVTDTGGNGIMIGEGQTRQVGDEPWWQASPEQAAIDNRVANCVVEGCGRELFGAVGIWVGLAAGTTVAHNEVRNHPYTGVSIGWMWWNPRSRPEPRKTPCERTQVLDNHIHHTMLTLSDGGCIYSLGNQPNSVIRGNLIHDIPANEGRAESNGMFLDQGTGSFTIEENLIYNVDRSPLRFHKGWQNLVRNNVLVLKPGVPPVRYNDTVQKRIRLEDNQVVERVPEDVLETFCRHAGLEESYRARLLPP